MIKPYWFLEAPVDTEHKYYILMDFLTKAKKKFNRRGFQKHVRDILTVKRDLENFDKEVELSHRTLANMTEYEKEIFYNLLDKNTDNVDEIKTIVENSIKTIEQFIEDNKDAIAKYNSLVDVESYCSRYNLWDQGFLIVRKNGVNHMKVFTWCFSVIKILDKEKIALLMTELLDPQCETTVDVNQIKKFLKSNIKSFSDKDDCLLIVDVSKELDIETGTEIGKEKSIEIILNNFNNS